MTEKHITTDVLIIGGGISGLFAAIKAREKGAKVILVDKNYVSRTGSTVWSDTLTVFNPEWGHDKEQWLAFLNSTFEGMNNPEWTDIFFSDSYERYKDLVSWGIEFPKAKNGDPSSLKMSHVPIQTQTMFRGAQFLPKLRKHATESGVQIIDHVMITDLIKQDGKIVGAVGFNKYNGDFYVLNSKATVSCSGGAGFKTIKYMAVANLTGDGEAMAYRAGAEISSKDFSLAAMPAFTDDKDDGQRVDIRSKPIDETCTGHRVWTAYIPQVSMFDAFVDCEGKRLSRFTGMAAIHEGRGPLLLDIDNVEPAQIEWAEHNVNQWNETYRIERVGLENMHGRFLADTFRPETSVGWGIPGGGSGMAPTDLYCATTLQGLFAAGDCYNSRMFGANYPYIGFGQANATITGARAGCSAAEYAVTVMQPEIDAHEIQKLKDALYAPVERKGGFSPQWAIQQLHTLIFSYYISIIKHGDRLDAALKLVEFLKGHIGPRIYAKDLHQLRLAHEAKNMFLNAEMVLRSSLYRQESRGSHYREDFPSRNDAEWLSWVKLKEKDGEMELFKEPIPEENRKFLSLPYKKRYFMKFPKEVIQ